MTTWAFFFKLRGREAEVDERVQRVAQVLGVEFRHLLGRMPRQLSGGEQQRVAVGRCIIRDPRVFLFDEPLSNLDAQLRGRTRVEIKRLLRRFGITAVYVTHDQIEAMALGDRIAIMRAGRVEQVGTDGGDHGGAGQPLCGRLLWHTTNEPPRWCRQPRRCAGRRYAVRTARA